MERARMEAVAEVLSTVLDAAEYDIETLEWARSQLDLYIDQVRNVPSEIKTRFVIQRSVE